MELYKNKKEIDLTCALVRLLTDNTARHNYEYMISIDGDARIACFGKTWTRRDPLNWGKPTPKLYIHREYCPVIVYDNRDVFIVSLLQDCGLKTYFNEKKFHVWEEVK